MIDRFFEVFKRHRSNAPSESKPYTTITKLNKAGRPNYIERYENLDGYPYPCGICGKKATQKISLFDHLWQPQGSLYYCGSCSPKDNSIMSD